MRQKFDPMPQCPKCTSNDLDLRYQYNPVTDDEWLRHQCNDCGFSWEMETADTEGCPK